MDIIYVNISELFIKNHLTQIQNRLAPRIKF